MAQIDILEDVVVPESPRTVDNEQLFVYVPIATYRNKGIASFSSDDFVVNNGEVMLRVRLSEFEKTLSNKLDKYDKGGKGSILYGVTDDGEQAMFLSDRLPIEDTIAIRDENGNVKTNKPVENNDAINKFYGHNTFANALKGSVSGSVVAMNDISPLEHELDVKVNINLIPYPYKETTKTENGITFTDNGDGTITANGTATARTTFFVSNGVPIGSNESQVYTWSALTEEGGDTTFYAYCIVNDDYYYDVGEGKSFTCSSATFSGVIVIVEGATVNNLVFKPQLKADIDIGSVEVKRYGKNLMPYPYRNTTKTENGITFTDNGDGTIAANGTATNTAIFYIKYYDDDYNSGTYTISGAKGGSLGEGSYHIQVASLNNTFSAFDVTDEHTFTMDKADKLLIMIVIYKGYTANNLVFEPMLEMNTVATPYEPYIEPTTYAVEADGTVKGVTSLYPTTTLIASNSGALIECEYNRDINKAFEELRQIIISLGGNI